MVSKISKNFRLREIQNRKEQFLKEHTDLKPYGSDRDVPVSLYWKHRSERLETTIRAW